jgi:hypothetical protein
MHRCAPAAAALAAALLLALPAAPALAQVDRHFPANALRGQAVFQPPPALQLNGRDARMAPGVRVRNERNMIVMPATLMGGKADVDYTLDMFGQVKEIWILTDDERAKQPWPRTPQEAAAWVFDYDTQTWSKR